MKYENLRMKTAGFYKGVIDRRIKDVRRIDDVDPVGDYGMHTAWLWSTHKDQELYRADKIDAATLKKRAEKNVTRLESKQLKKDMDRLTAAEMAGTPDTIEIAIEWKKNRWYGYNPHASIVTPGGTYRAHVSGCGYDKASAVVGQVLNLYPGALAIIYNTMEKALAQDNTLFDQKVFGYGAAAEGYPLPGYQEKGIGLSSFKALFDRCGYDMSTHYRDGVAVWITITKREGNA